MILVDVGSARLFCDVVGDSLDAATPKMDKRPVLILLHGGPGYNHSTLRPYFDRYSDTHQLIYLFLLGCGHPTSVQETWHLDQWANDLAVFLTTLGIDSPIVFGQSFGEMIAMHFAASYPAGLSKLNLSSTAAQFRLDETVKIMRKLGGDRTAEVSYQFFSNPSKGAYDTYGEVCLPLYSNPNAPQATAFLERAIERLEEAIHFFADEMASMDMRAEIANITFPTSVIGGTMDPLTPILCS